MPNSTVGKTNVQLIIDKVSKIRTDEVPDNIPAGWVLGKHDTLNKLQTFLNNIISDRVATELKEAYIAGQKNIHRSEHDWFDETYPTHGK